MSRKWWIGLGVVVVLISLLLVFRQALFFSATTWYLKPSHTFAQGERPAPPDYSNPESWAALPDRQDGADKVPTAGGFVDRQAQAAVDVFFIHPTTYYNNAGWNQPLTDETANGLTDDYVLPAQASVFNGCCRIYAPRYRQATLYAFMDDTGDGESALQVAYEDVEAAFAYFLMHYNRGRPFIIAGHSQGSAHADRLLREHIAGTQLMPALVAAYPVGYFLQAGPVPVCGHATDLGCLVTWNSVGRDAVPYRDTTSDICVNPLTWRTDGEHADHGRNLGGVSFSAGGRPEVGVADAQCRDGQLVISEIRSDNYGIETGPDNHHLYDYSLFWVNLRTNAIARVDAYLAARAAPRDALIDSDRTAISER